MPEITSAMARMARAALGLDRRSAAKMLDVGFPTLSRLEQGVVGVRPATKERVQRAYERQGVQFLWAGDRVAVSVLEATK